MDLQLAKRYPLQASPAQAWALLANLPATAACMPGAEITERTDETHYRGRVRARIGPAQMAFDGEIELLAQDAVARSVAFVAKGADKAGSAASMQLQAHIEAGEAGGSILVGAATVRVSGKLAQIGNRLLLPASEALLAQFAQHFNTAALAQAPAAEAPAEAGLAAGLATDGNASSTPPSVAPPPPAAAAPLNLFTLFWATLRAWWQGRKR